MTIFIHLTKQNTISVSSQCAFSVQFCLVFANTNISIFYHHSWLESSHIVCLFAVKKVAVHIFAHLKIEYLCKNCSWILSSILILTEFLSGLGEIITVSTLSRLELKVFCFQSPLEYLGTSLGAHGNLLRNCGCMLLQHKEPLKYLFLHYRTPGPRQSFRRSVRLQGVPWAFCWAHDLQACLRCAVVKGLCFLVKELWEEATRLHSIKEDEKHGPELLRDLADSKAWALNCRGRGRKSLCLYEAGK